MSSAWGLARTMAFVFALAALVLLVVTLALLDLQPGPTQTVLVGVQVVLVVALFLLGLLADGARYRTVPDVAPDGVGGGPPPNRRMP